VDRLHFFSGADPTSPRSKAPVKSGFGFDGARRYRTHIARRKASRLGSTDSYCGVRLRMISNILAAQTPVEVDVDFQSRPPTPNHIAGSEPCEMDTRTNSLATGVSLNCDFQHSENPNPALSHQSRRVAISLGCTYFSETSFLPWPSHNLIRGIGTSASASRVALK
jgi:hypothetical protein